MPEFAVWVDGKKLVWDGELYSDETMAAETSNVIIEGGEPS